ncbi:MAG: hypothetical protein ACXWEW_09730, partial [Nitrososphaeraceae archaeon]
MLESIVYSPTNLFSIKHLTGATGMTGPQGTPGTLGPTGLTGPEDPSGITFVNGTNVYLNQTQKVYPFGPVFGEARCDPGDFVVNGGYRIIGFNFRLDINRPFVGELGGIPPFGSPPGGGWETILFNFDN